MVKNETINRAIDYIFAHIEEKITIEDVAEYCNYSKFHFSRLFKEEMGESLYSFIKRNRLIRSATKIKLEPEKSIAEIGMEFGYSSSNYATAFRELVKQSPVSYRNERKERDEIYVPLFQKGFQKLRTFEEYDAEITIAKLPERRVHYQRFVGSYEELMQHWKAFVRKNQSYVTEDTLWVERSLSDPEITEKARCICDICMTVSEDCPLLPVRRLSGGKYAMYHFHGFREQIYVAYQGLFSVWLPNSSYHCVFREEALGQLRDMYDIVHKVEEETGMLTLSICIPIE